MEIEKLAVFMQSASSFFEQFNEQLHSIDTPYLNDNAHPIAFDFSGIICITGPIVGSVYVSASTMMLRELLHVIGEPDVSMAMFKDLIGEIANTVSGNARTEFGSDFIISTPTVVMGVPNHQYLPKERRSYVIPFYWRNYKAIINICIWQS